jgi:hypothetical protein
MKNDTYSDAETVLALIAAAIVAIIILWAALVATKGHRSAPPPQAKAQPQKLTDDEAKLIARGSICLFLDKVRDMTASDEIDHERTKALTAMAETYFRFDVDEAAYWWNHELDRTARPGMGMRGDWSQTDCPSYEKQLTELAKTR